ncbi:hypothetical protein Mapa_004796 [Marchantia paleacea]|nr:hypothetical protein Mapa_004796 [Marchantia paleacea]
MGHTLLVAGGLLNGVTLSTLGLEDFLSGLGVASGCFGKGGHRIPLESNDERRSNQEQRTNFAKPRNPRCCGVAMQACGLEYFFKQRSFANTLVS